MKANNILKIALILVLFSGCNEMMDCIFSVKPNLPQKTFTVGKVGVAYLDELKASVINDSREGDYYYYFDLYGNLPDGIEILISGRTMYFQGTPTKTGRFNFDVSVQNESKYVDEDGDDNICFGDDTIQKSYFITITN